MSIHKQGNSDLECPPEEATFMPQVRHAPKFSRTKFFLEHLDWCKRFYCLDSRRFFEQVVRQKDDAEDTRNRIPATKIGTGIGKSFKV
jgi:hypothetical protein